ncbi:amino acid adenylation domain-containing protein [Ralstonia nicotianae]
MNARSIPSLQDDHRLPLEGGLGDLFAIGCALHPDEPAVADGKSAFTFRELEHGATRLAHRLAAAGVERGARVVVFGAKLAVMPVTAVAAWKLNAVYVPLDGSMPIARARALLDRIQPRAVISLDGTVDVGAYCADARIPRLSQHDLLGMLTDRSPVEPLPHGLPADAHAPAYIIFTSGSTGTPKGVEIAVGSLRAYFRNHNRVLRFDAASRVFSLAPFHFDVSIEDTLLPLSVGAYVFQFRGVPAGAIMREALSREKVTHLIAVSTLLTLITGAPGDLNRNRFPALRAVMTGAEVCDPAIINAWKDSLPGARLFNAYGPTETTIVCMNYEIEAVDTARANAYPIGRPLDGVEAMVVDHDSGERVSAQGVPGELWIGGPQVMNRYFDQPEETAKVIVERDGVRYYRTGDICSYDACGEIVFHGRADDEVKISGRRIHLGEIRQLILALPGVSRAAVAVVTRNGRDQIGAVAMAADVGILAQIEQHLAEQLPEYMRPGVLAWSPQPQMTSTGKTDEKSIIERLKDALKRSDGRYFALSAKQIFEPASSASEVA